MPVTVLRRMNPHAHLQEVATSFLERSRAPYSGHRASAALLLPDGYIVPGVRVESASFSLSIPAALNAISTAVAAGYRAFSAMAISGRIPPTTDAFLRGFGLLPGSDSDVWASQGPSPEPGEVLTPFLRDLEPGSTDLIRRARSISQHAHIPESNFPVGAVIQTSDGRFVPGVNVEHADWTCILCAERNALGSAVTFDALPAVSLGLSCPTDPGASPCGACRQLIAELVPDASVWMDRGDRAPESMTPDDLLPLAFFGDSLGS